MVIILHAADFHLDAPSPSFLVPGDAVRRREERLTAFERVMRVAAERGAELVLIAGDLLENVHARRQTVRRAAEAFAALQPAQVLIAPGNHDPFVSSGFYAVHEWPSNVHVFPPGWTQWTSRDGKCVVSGFGWDRAEITEPLLRNCPPAPAGTVHIVLIHGDSLARGGRSVYLPISRGDLESCRAQYVALGHVHRAEPQQAGRLLQRWMNPGAPEPLDFGEAEALRGVVWGRVGTDGCELELAPVKPMREYRLRTIEVDGLDGEPAVAERIRNQLPEDQRKRDFFRLTLTGRLEPDVKLSLVALRGLLEDDFCFWEAEDQTHAAYHLEAIAAEPGFRGEFVRAMFESAHAASAQDAEEMMRALELGLEAMAGRDVNAQLLEERPY